MVCAQGRLGNGFVFGCRGDTAQMDMAHPEGIARAEDRANIPGGADIVEKGFDPWPIFRFWRCIKASIRRQGMLHLQMRGPQAQRTALPKRVGLGQWIT